MHFRFCHYKFLDISHSRITPRKKKNSTVSLVYYILCFSDVAMFCFLGKYLVFYKTLLKKDTLPLQLPQDDC